MKRPSLLAMAFRVVLALLVLLLAAWHVLGPPAAVRNLADPAQQVSAEAMLRLCGKWSLGALDKGLHAEDPARRAAVARFLGPFVAEGHAGGKAEGVVEALGLLLGLDGDADADVRLAAAGSLAKLAPDLPPAREPLKAGLTDADGRVRVLVAKYFDSPGAPALAADEWGGLLGDEEPMVRLHAARALGRLGPAAVPALDALMAALDDPAVLVRTLAVQALGSMGLAEDSSPGLRVEALGGMLGDNDCGGAAALALASLRGPGRDALVAALGDDDPEIRAQAAKGLARVDPDLLLQSGDALDLLARNLADDTIDVAVNSAQVLLALGPEAAPALDLVLAALESGDPDVRTLAARVVGSVGRDAERSVPALAGLLADEAEPVRVAAAQALVAFGPEVGRAAPELIAALTDDSPVVRMAAAASVLELMQLDGAAAPGLAAALEDELPEVRQAAAYGLGVVGPGMQDAQAGSVVHGLRHALAHDSDPEVSSQAALALARLDDDSPETLDALTQALQSASGVQLMQTAMALGSLGRRDPALPETLARDAASEDPALRQAAVAVLYWMDSGQTGVRDLLLGLAQDPEFSIRVSAIMALDRHGRGSAEALALLSSLLGQDPSPHVRKAAAMALGDVDTASPEAAQALAQALADPDGALRLEAAISLRRLQPAAVADAPEAVAALVAALGDEEDGVRTAAALCLGNLAQAGLAGDALQAEAADDALEALGRDGTIEDRVAAAAALAAMGRMDRDLAMQHVEQGLGLDDVYFRGAAFSALHLLGLAPGQVLDLLAPALADGSPLVRATALAALEPLGADAEPFLAAALQDGSAMVRSQAASSLARTGAALPATLDALRAAATSDLSLAVRYDARAALAAMD